LAHAGRICIDAQRPGVSVSGAVATVVIDIIVIPVVVVVVVIMVVAFAHLISHFHSSGGTARKVQLEIVNRL
jgi:hypothetical protein